MLCKSPARKAIIPNSHSPGTGSTLQPSPAAPTVRVACVVCTAGGCLGLQDAGAPAGSMPSIREQIHCSASMGNSQAAAFLGVCGTFFLGNIRYVTDTYALKIITDNIFHYFPNTPHGGAEALHSSLSTAKLPAGHPELLPAAVPCPGMHPPPHMTPAGDGQRSATTAHLWPASTSAAAHTCAVRHNCFSIHKQKIVLVLQPANRAELPQESNPHSGSHRCCNLGRTTLVHSRQRQLCPATHSIRLRGQGRANNHL